MSEAFNSEIFAWGMVVIFGLMLIAETLHRMYMQRTLTAAFEHWERIIEISEDASRLTREVLHALTKDRAMESEKTHD